MPVFLQADGSAVRVPMAERRKGHGLSRDQLRRLRNAEWLRDFEARRRPVALIAALYGVGDQTVRDGIAAARELRELLRETGATADPS